MEKLLTIIIPAYNTEKYILRCLNSVIHPLVHVIIIDDGSSDSTPQIVDDFCSKNDSFEVIHTQNSGAVSARITGLKSVKTEYFSFVDSDDIVNIENYINLVLEMKLNNNKVGNGRSTVYLPNCIIPFRSRKWKKEKLDFFEDKSEFCALSCALWDKIWHIDCAPLFMEQSTQKVYEDLEVVYHVVATQRYLLHTNDLIYSYCMRGLENNSTAAIGLQMNRSNGIRGLISASISMTTKFKNSNLYEYFKEELEAIIIKLFYQRIFNVLTHSEIINKKEMAKLIFEILDSLIPKWETNKYLQEGFKDSEYNDYLFYIGTQILQRLYNVQVNHADENYNALISEYDKRLILKK